MGGTTSNNFAGAALLTLRQLINWTTPALIGGLVVRQRWITVATSSFPRGWLRLVPEILLVSPFVAIHGSSHFLGRWCNFCRCLRPPAPALACWGVKRRAGFIRSLRVILHSPYHSPTPFILTDLILVVVHPSGAGCAGFGSGLNPGP
jgi:hypothetical protein